MAPCAIQTPFGWWVVGPLHSARSNYLRCNHLSIGNTPELDVLFERFYDDDSFGVVNRTVQPVSPENKSALQILETRTLSWVIVMYPDEYLINRDFQTGQWLKGAFSPRTSFKNRPFISWEIFCSYKWIYLGHARKLSSEESINGPTDEYGGYLIIQFSTWTSQGNFALYLMPLRHFKEFHSIRSYSKNPISWLA